MRGFCLQFDGLGQRPLPDNSRRERGIERRGGPHLRMLLKKYYILFYRWKCFGKRDANPDVTRFLPGGQDGKSYLEFPGSRIELHLPEIKTCDFH